MVGYQHVVQTPWRVNCGGLATAWTLHDIISKPVLNQFKLWTWINFQIKIADYSLKHLQECRMTWRKRKKRTRKGMKQKWSCRSRVRLRLVFKELRPFFSGKVTRSLHSEEMLKWIQISAWVQFLKVAELFSRFLVKMSSDFEVCGNGEFIASMCKPCPSGDSLHGVFLSQKLVLLI